MSVRAKFKVSRIEQESVDGRIIELKPVTGGSAENQSFYRWTPSGVIELRTISEFAAKQFEFGKEFYVDFTPAEQAGFEEQDMTNTPGDAIQ